MRVPKASSGGSSYHPGPRTEVRPRVDQAARAPGPPREETRGPQIGDRGSLPGWSRHGQAFSSGRNRGAAVRPQGTVHSSGLDPMEVACVRLGVKAALVDGELVDGTSMSRTVSWPGGCPPAGSHGIAVPGFVDVHINGTPVSTSWPRGGVPARAAGARGTGVVAYQPTFVSSRRRRTATRCAPPRPCQPPPGPSARARRPRRGPVPITGVAGCPRARVPPPA